MTSTPRRWASMTTSLPSSPEPSSSRRVAPADSGVPILTNSPGRRQWDAAAATAYGSASGGSNEEGEPQRVDVRAELLVAELDTRLAAAPAVTRGDAEAVAGAVLVERVVAGDQVAVAVAAGDDGLAEVDLEPEPRRGRDAKTDHAGDVGGRAQVVGIGGHALDAHAAVEDLLVEFLVVHVVVGFRLLGRRVRLGALLED